MSVTAKNMTVNGSNTVGNILPLDIYSNASAAYSLRKLKSSYTGSAIRVRRSLDNTEQDIGFNATGIIDTYSLFNFVGIDNLVQYSEQFDNGYWLKSNSSINQNSTTDPNGGNTADAILETNTTTNHRITSTSISGITNGTTYIFSIYVKKANVDYVGLVVNNTFPTGNGAWFNISNGTVTSTGTGTTSAIANAGNGWWRCSITVTATSNGSTNFIINPSSIDGNEVYTGIEFRPNVYVWGAQVSVGFLKTYYATTTNANTGFGYVTKWYDQSGSNNAEQTTTTLQPTVVENGIVNTYNNKCIIKYNKSKLTITNLTSRIEPITAIAVFITNSNAFGFILNKNSYFATTQTDFPFYIAQLGTNGNNIEMGSDRGNDFSVDATLTSTISKNVYSLAFGTKTTSLMTFVYNNTLQTVSAAFSLSNNTRAFSIGQAAFENGGGVGTSSFLGSINELIIYPADYTSKRLELCGSINGYYSIY